MVRLFPCTCVSPPPPSPQAPIPSAARTASAPDAMNRDARTFPPLKYACVQVIVTARAAAGSHSPRSPGPLQASAAGTASAVGGEGAQAHFGTLLRRRPAAVGVTQGGAAARCRRVDRVAGPRARLRR